MPMLCLGATPGAAPLSTWLAFAFSQAGAWTLYFDTALLCALMMLAPATASFVIFAIAA